MPFSNPANSITIPNGATTGPRIVIGNDVPPELFSASPFGLRLTSVILYFVNDTDYSFEGVGTFGVAFTGTFSGIYSVANGLFVAEQLLDVGGAGAGRMQRDLSGTTQIDVALTANDHIYASTANASAEMTGGANTASGVFAVVSGAPSFTSFIKRFDESTLEYDLRLSNFANAANTGVEFGIRCSRPSPAFTQDTSMGKFLHNAASQHMPFSSIRRNAASSVVAGTYKIEILWRRDSGTGTLFVDGNDSWSLTVKEAL